MPDGVSEETSFAERLLELAAGEASGADVEITVERTRLSLTRFANSRIHQNVADDVLRARVRLHREGRTATLTSTRLDDEGAHDLAARAAASVAVAPLDPGWPGVAPPSEAGDVAAVDRTSWDATPDDRAQRVGAFIDAAAGLEVAGYCRTTSTAGAFVNSAGQRLTTQSAEVAMDGVARQNGVDGVARLASGRLGDIDGGVLGARAAAKARHGVDAVELPPGRYEVVFEPAATADVLLNMSVYGYNGKSVHDGTSFVRVGEAQLDPSVTLVDDAPASGSAYDPDGTPRSRLTVVDAGVSTAVPHDRRTAMAAGATSTGHGTPMPTWGAFGMQLGLSPSDRVAGDDGEVDGPAAQASTLALVAGVTRGVLVTDLFYTRVLDPRQLAVTGLTRNGVWLIENGEITSPLRNFRFTQAYPEALAPGRVLGIGSVVEPQPDSWASARWWAPAVHLASWNFTGGASG